MTPWGKIARGWLTGLLACAQPAWAQWETIERQGVPRKADGTFDAEAPTPRLADGKPDFSGVWQADQLPPGAYEAGVDVENDGIPYKPWARDLVRRRFERQYIDDPGSRCAPIGALMLMYGIPPVSEFIHRPDVLTALFETSGVHATFRQVFLDGRSLPEDPYPSYMGFSVGHWEGDTLVIHSQGYNGKIWLDVFGRPSTDRMRVTERLTRPNFGRIDVEVTIDDPGAYEAPWSVRHTLRYAPKGNLTDTYCDENDFERQLADAGLTLESVDSRDFMPPEPVEP